MGRSATARISQRSQAMPRSEVRDVMELAWGAGSEVIRLEVGESDFPTPEQVTAAAGAAAVRGETRYTPNAGLPALREALAGKVRAVNGYSVHPDEVVVTAGGVQALFAAMAVLCEAGDEILLPDPAWPDFGQQAHVLGLRTVPYRLTSGTAFLPDLDELSHLVSPRTSAILLNTPSNPLGSVLPVDTIRSLVAFAERNGLWIIADEVYDQVVFDDPFNSLRSVVASDRIVSIYSFSKIYAMTGWRVGYMVVPATLAPVFTALQEPIVSCVNAPAQYGAMAALEDASDIVVEMRDAYRRRRDLVVDELLRGGLRPSTPQGSFYVWVELPDGVDGDAQFARGLIDAERVAVAPGSAFGTGGRNAVRLSLAAAEDDLIEGARRLARYCRTAAPATTGVAAK